MRDPIRRSYTAGWVSRSPSRRCWRTSAGDSTVGACLGFFRGDCLGELWLPGKRTCRSFLESEKSRYPGVNLTSPRSVLYLVRYMLFVFLEPTVSRLSRRFSFQTSRLASVRNYPPRSCLRNVQKSNPNPLSSVLTTPLVTPAIPSPGNWSGKGLFNILIDA